MAYARRHMRERKGFVMIACRAFWFSLVGILPAHGVLHAFFTATSMIGFIAGAGIVVRNSIILVDFIELRLLDHILDVAAQRFLNGLHAVPDDDQDALAARLPGEIDRVAGQRAPAERVWAHASTFAGVNRELWPLARMTFPPAMSRLTPEAFPVGRTAFRSSEHRYSWRSPPSPPSGTASAPSRRPKP